MAVGHVGRGYGMGWNRLHTRADQLHGGQDFMVGPGTPIHAPLPGRVVLVSHESGPGYNQAMTGYGNAVVLQHDFALPVPTTPLPGQSRPPARGLPTPFWTSYNHMRDAPVVRVGQQVRAGDLLGYVGNTNNGSFPGMPPHLHVEVRKRAFPSSYDNDTIDPNLLWASLGIDLTGSHQEAGRRVGGTLLVRQGGPSDCGPGVASDLHGWLGEPVPAGGQASAGQQYVSPTTLSSKYNAGTTPATIPDVDPPDYSSIARSGVSPAVVVAGVVIGVGAAAISSRRNRRR
jgi:murein DD-endopeptidase MepM/ murein hydrolase activator NlpD